MNVTVKSEIDIPRAMRKIENATFWKFAATEWHRLITPYTPWRDGNLARNVDIQPKEIYYQMTDYATRMYYWRGHFRTDHNELASREWDKAAEAAGKDKDLIAAMQGYIDSGRLGLNSGK